MDDDRRTDDRSTPSDRVALVEETAHVAVLPVVSGLVKVSTRVETFEQVAHAELHGDVVDVTTVSRNEPVTGAMPQTRTEGDVTIVPVFEEILVVEKRLVLKEELHIRKRVVTETLDVPVTLRRETATVDRADLPDNTVAS